MIVDEERTKKLGHLVFKEEPKSKGKKSSSIFESSIKDDEIVNSKLSEEKSLSKKKRDE